MLQRLMDIDRRVIYVLVFLVVLFPLIRPVGLPLAITPEVRASYDWIHKTIVKDDLVLIDVAFPAQASAELWPQLTAMSKDLMNIGAKIVLVSYNADAFRFQEAVYEEIAPQFGYEYGKDILLLPFKAGGESAYMALGRDICALYGEDYYGKPLREFPLWERVKSIKDFSAMFCFDAGEAGMYVIRHIGQVSGVPVASGTAAATGAFLMPFWQSKQLSGLVVGMSGAAEYELLSSFLGSAAGAMDAQSFGHMLIVLLVVLGNVGFLVSNRRSGK